MPEHETENLTAYNEAENNKAKTLSALYAKQREMKTELLQRDAKNKDQRDQEIHQSAEREWKLVIDLVDEMTHRSHGYGAGWTRLYDLAWALKDALVKDSSFKIIDLDPYITPVVSTASYVVGGVAGGLVGGLGRLFGVGDGLVAVAKSGVRFVTGASNDEVQYFVDMNDEGTLDYWLKRSDGKELTRDEKLGYVAEVQCWLNGLGFKAGDAPWTYIPPLPEKALFAQDRDHPDFGLAKYLTSKQLEVKQRLGAEKLEVDEPPEVWQSVSMR